ncbi:MAG: hypothetical protein J0G94_00795, partial [Sphingomonadales bacterium]|nr:hypothetical protein [Sphingomonadales bacterium]
MFGTHTAAPAPAGQQAANAGSGASPPQQGSGQPSSASQPAGSSAAPAEEPPTPPVEGAGSGGRASAAQPNAAGLYRDTDGY